MDDLQRVAADLDSDWTTQTNLNMIIPSRDDCEEAEMQVISLVEDLVHDVWSRGCEEREDGTYLLINFRIPIVHGLNAWREANVLFGVMLYVSEQGSVVYFMNNLELYHTLKQRISLELGESLNLADSRFRFLVRTFLTPHIIAAGGVFAYGEPIDGTREIEVKRRERISIELSNVAAANLEENGSAIIFYLQR